MILRLMLVYVIARGTYEVTTEPGFGSFPWWAGLIASAVFSFLFWEEFAYRGRSS